MNVSDLAFGDNGLVPVVVQDRLEGRIRMVAYANAEAVERTRDTGEAHFWSRSRKALWRKGETSGNVLRVTEIFTDCDHDALVYLAEAAGPTCHTGQETCFFDRLHGDPDGPSEPLPFVSALEAVVSKRAEESSRPSYTRSLLVAGGSRVAEKIREEAGELATAVESESAARVVSECADVLFHVLVALRLREVGWVDVLRELARRFGVSGLTEKASRTQATGPQTLSAEPDTKRPSTK